MKTLKLFYSSITLVAVICATLFTGRTLAQGISYTSSPAITYTTPAGSGSIEQGKADLRERLEAVKYEKKRIEYYKARYKADKAAGRKADAIADQKEITRSCGNLKMAKAHLKAEKDMIIDNYNLAIQTHREAVRHDRKMLARSKVILNRDLAAISEKSDNDAREVIRWQKNLARDKEALDRKRTAKNNDLIAINKQIKKQNGQFVGTLYAENAVASTVNWIEK